jgi:hypothetical protein
MSFGRDVLGGTSVSNTVTGFAVRSRGRIRQPAQQPRLMLLFGPVIFSARRCAHVNFCKKLVRAAHPEARVGPGTGPVSYPPWGASLLPGTFYQPAVTWSSLISLRSNPVRQTPRLVGNSNIRIIRFGGT